MNSVQRLNVRSLFKPFPAALSEPLEGGVTGGLVTKLKQELPVLALLSHFAISPHFLCSSLLSESKGSSTKLLEKTPLILAKIQVIQDAVL